MRVKSSACFCTLLRIIGESINRRCGIGRPFPRPNGFTSAPAVNNLCMLLALHRPSEAARAIKQMDEVITLRGPVTTYLDTRAVAYLVRGGKAAEAATDLNLALIQLRNPVYLFHLA